MTILDISRRIGSSRLTYPGDPEPGLEPVTRIGVDSPFAVTALSGFTTHTLTHVDVPAHFFPGGSTLDDFPLDRFVVPALVVDTANASSIAAGHVPTGLNVGDAVLFRTGDAPRDGDAYQPRHCFLEISACAELIRAGAGLVGIDQLSVDSGTVDSETVDSGIGGPGTGDPGPGNARTDRHDAGGGVGFPAHRALLAASVLILEGLDLSSVPAGRYTLIALPLRLGALDGSPCRAVLLSPPW